MERFVVVVQNTATGEEPFSSVVMKNVLYQLIHACSDEEALEIAATFRPDFFLIEHRWSAGESTMLPARLHALRGQEDVPIVVVLCNGTFPSQRCSGANDLYVSYVEGPFQLEHLLQMAENMCVLTDW